MSSFVWPTNRDGTPKTFGEMTPDERRAATNDAIRHLQAELSDPTSAFRRGIEAVLLGPYETTTKQ